MAVAAAAGDSPDEFIGVTIAGRYRIISRLGAGGMGVAYRAWDEQDGVPVVIKIPKKVFFEDPRFAERFFREMRLLQGLGHQHIAPITDVGEHDGLPFVVLRFLPGGSLSNRRLRDENGRPKPNPAGMLHLWLPAVAEALDFIHSKGVVHRDVKPANIFFDAFWGAYLGDFGIAKIVEESDAFDKEHTLTATHMGIGTQEYMSPEQFTPKAAVDGRADQYALAVMVYEMLAGVRPFTGSTSNLIVEVLTHPVPPLQSHRRDLPVSLCDAVDRGLAKSPPERFPTCREFAAAVLRDVPPLKDEPGVARLLCPKCANMLKLPTEAAGRKGKCTRCQTAMKVAEDLGALWLLDEARRQKRAVAETDTVELDEGFDSEGSSPVDEQIETFEPVTTKKPVPLKPVPRRDFAVAVVLAAGVLLLWLAASGKPPKGRTPNQKNSSAAAEDESDAVRSYEKRLAEAERTLASKPTDRAANELVGRHLSFRKQDWAKGLPYLAKSNAVGLAAAAEQELAANEFTKDSPGHAMQAAHLWWTLASGNTVNSQESAAIKTHAVSLYKRHVGLWDGWWAEADLKFANEWLDEDTVFRNAVQNTRPGYEQPLEASGVTGNFYRVFATNLSWNDAKKFCELIRGHLAIITSPEEQAYVRRLIASTGNGRRFLLGASDSHAEDDWRWVDGSLMTYSAWATGQPDKKATENFLYADMLSDGKWADGPASADYAGFVCEWEASDRQRFGEDASAAATIKNSIGIEMRLMPPGTFQMGSSDGDPDEKPVHEVQLTKPFYLGVTEVTNAQWKAAMGDVPSQWKDDSRPVEQVSWEDVAKFCEKLSALPAERAAGREYRLPTEAEWEYACRAGTTTHFSYGDNPNALNDFGWFRATSAGETHAVALRKPSPWGLYDMHGNVWELVRDCYGAYENRPVTDPQGPPGAPNRVIRGGSWFDTRGLCRSAKRGAVGPAIRQNNVGFRLALSPPVASSPEQAHKLQAELDAAYATLKTDPSDQSANGVVGRHICLTDGKWSDGLPYLAKSGTGEVALVARAELLASSTGQHNGKAGASPMDGLGSGMTTVDPGTLVAVAEKWWSLAGRPELGKQEHSAVVRSHAAELFKQHVGSLASDSDVAFANDWLDGDPAFRSLVGNMRPPELPRTTFAFSQTDLAKQFVLYGDVVINDQNEIECRDRSLSRAITKAKFKIPLRAEFVAYAYAFGQRPFGIGPAVLTDEKAMRRLFV